MPRDLDPAINDLDNVYLYNIDDLKEVVEQGWQHRRQEAARAERLVAAETVKFEDWLQTLEVYPTIIALKDKAEAICQAELKKTLSQLGPVSPEQRQALEVLTDSVTQKLLHDPIIFPEARPQHEEEPPPGTGPGAPPLQPGFGTGDGRG